MTFTERKKFCENIIAPYKDQLSDEILAEIYNVCSNYNYEFEEISEMEQKFELGEMICWILDDNGFPVYADMEKDNA